MEKQNDDPNKGKFTKKKMRNASLQEIGNALNLTRMCICQLEKMILDKIRNSGKLDEFK